MHKHLNPRLSILQSHAVQQGVGLLCFMCGLFSMPVAQAQTSATPATAQTLGQVTSRLYTSFLPAQVFLSSIVFILGVWIVYQGVISLRGTGEGGQNAPAISATLLKLGGGGALISLPFIIDMVLRTTTNSGLGAGNEITLKDGGTHTFSGPGLDQAVGRFVQDFFVPFMGSALPYFCYMLGTVMIIRGIQRLANGGEKGPKGPAGAGTWAIFIVASGLMSMGYFMRVLQGSIFGVDELYANVLLVDQSPLSQRAQNVLWAVFQFLRIIGYLSVMKGLLQFKAYANGDQGGSLMGASTHMIAGAMLANVWYFIWAVQKTFVDDPDYFVFQKPV